MINILMVFTVLILLMTGVLVIGGNYFYKLAIDTGTSKASVFKSKDNMENSKYAQKETLREKNDKEWFFKNSNYSDVFINSFDGLKLHGYKIVNSYDTDKWIIAVHGYDGDSIKMCGRARNFYNMGFNVIIPDLRGHGQSDGSYIGMGWHDRKDLLGWIDYIINENNNSEIILYGISMGASTVMMTCGENLKNNVKAAIEDSGYTSVWDQFAYILKCMFKLPQFPIMYVANIITKMRARYDLKEASSVNQLAKCKIPVLFIHGDKDKFVPFNMLKKVYDSAKCEKEMLIIEGAGHCKSNKINPKLYWETISEFLDKYLTYDMNREIM
ncbi:MULTISPECIES: alpha/beta hydrolase [Clostridium]|uniref:Alpha/beta fold hydrolase n=2 Tax=Clostridium butyricum TaxID=1492 RepID=A0A512TRS3_CLOBU|nr:MULTISPECIES: alpha/beta hydrolase [Clostridium]AXB84677.1 alpha/beta hydrolase [Clostridium butyricum]MBS4839621.1 alpha/beta hydrolase [Clostridium sp.]MDU1400770.1 alpha/beta hydrolase [Clostridium sp.]MDU2893614.1 alpha/beta hydrolase [Clostridium sp.]MDU3005527.1 alpha/beta hydrolase [Clostridium sp.]